MPALIPTLRPTTQLLTLLMASAGILLAGCHTPVLAPHPSVTVTRIPPNAAGGPEQMAAIEGRALGARPGQQIVIYAKNNIWWVQPFSNHPLTKIERDSTWKTMTHLGNDYGALLVDADYRPQPKIAALPAEGNGVSAVSIVHGAAAAVPTLKTIHFSGYDWTVRSVPSERGGEMNSYDPANIWTDEQGYLHLHMGEKDGRWSCAEVSLTRSLGYGTYKSVVQDSAHLSVSGVLGIYTLDERLGEETRVEMDVELSQWGKAGNKNAQYVVQPYYIPSNIARFEVPAGAATHTLRWEPGSATFKTVSGVETGARPVAAARLISDHKFTSGIPSAAGETIHLDLYDFYHSKTNSQRPSEVVIEKFEYLP